jgi:hypothetical protein
MIANTLWERRMSAFRLEREMSERTRKWLVREKLTVKSEFAVPWGICDFVGVEFEPERVAHRLRLGQKKSIGSALGVDLLGHIPDQETGRSVSLLRLGKLYDGWLDSDHLVAELRKLKASKFVTCDEDLRRFQKINGWAPIHRRVVAVELKLWRTEEVLVQARANLAFATESWVGMPDSIAARIASQTRRARLFRESGIGLLAIGRARCRCLIVPLPRTTVANTLQLHVVERFWPLCIKDN